MKTAPRPMIGTKAIEAVLLHLDGVITQTSLLHARAWKMMLAPFLEARKKGRPLVPMDVQKEYLRYFNGKPHPEGIRSFLASRQIALPEGSRQDAPGTETLNGLTNLKSRMFLQLIDEEGVDVFGDTVTRLKQWRSEGKKIGVISTGTHCERVISRAGLAHLVDVYVEGTPLAGETLPGRPAPDPFLRAAEALGVSPGRAMVIRDVLSSGSPVSGAFGQVVGVNRHGDATHPAWSDAHVVVRSLSELGVAGSRPDPSVAAAGFPSVIEKFKAIGSGRLRKNIALLLSYDGALAAMITRPDRDGIRSLLERLASRCTVALLSRRDRGELEERIALPELVYAGSHGLDVGGPDGLNRQYPAAVTCLPDLYTAQKAFNRLLEDVEGIQIHRKRYALAVHCQRVPEDEIAYVKEVVYGIGQSLPKLTVTGDQNVFELRPAFDWNKSKAADWIMEALPLDPAEVVPVYLGSDPSDEDAFRRLKETGIGIWVGAHGRPTHADYRLEDPGQVQQLLLIALQFLQK